MEPKILAKLIFIFSGSIKWNKFKILWYVRSIKAFCVTRFLYHILLLQKETSVIPIKGFSWSMSTFREHKTRNDSENSEVFNTITNEFAKISCILPIIDSRAIQWGVYRYYGDFTLFPLTSFNKISILKETFFKMNNISIILHLLSLERRIRFLVCFPTMFLK